MRGMPPVRRVAAAAVAVLAVAIVAVLLLSGVDGPIGRGPRVPSVSPGAPVSSSPSPVGSDEPTASAGESPVAGDDGVRAVLADIEEQVLEIRGLQPPDIGPADLIGRNELRAELEGLFEADYPREEQERDNLTLRAFGLLGPDDDVGALQLELLTSQVAGFYDRTERRMVVVSDTGLDANARLTYAHEYTHALQDAAFGLGSLEIDAEGEDDRSLARVSLVEGDATVTMLSWALRNLSPAELGEIGAGPIPDTGDVPDWMLSQITFPYLAGQEWILAMMADAGGNPMTPEYEPVDAAFEDPPETTAQILDYETWVDRVPPVDVALPDLAASLGSGWEAVSESSVGQATTTIVLEHFGVTGFDGFDAGDGWTGDRAVVVRGPDGDFALAWRSAWATDEDAEEFESAYGTVVDTLDFPATVRRDGDMVLVIHASTEAVLDRAVEATR